jgi:competence protein ComEA
LLRDTLDNIGEKMKKYWDIAYGVLVGLLAAGVIIVSTSRPHGETVVLLPTSTPGILTIYVTGAVMHPGVYTLPDGSRVDAVILAAGGFAVGAEQDGINLAAILEDGQQIDVPGIVSTSHVNAGRVNINTATEDELDALPGIGPTTAQAIVEYRLLNGEFQTVQDIQNVPGVGPSTYDRIKDFISIE